MAISLTSLISTIFDLLGLHRSKFNLIDAGIIKIQQDDVFLVSYPRSGNTWMRYLLANLYFPEEEWNIENIGLVVPDIYERLNRSGTNRYQRLFKSHEPSNTDYPKVIYIYRDGRDVALSLFDFYQKLRNYEDDFNQFLELMLLGKLPYGSWQDHISSWLFSDAIIPLLSISYEDLYLNTLHELNRINTFLECNWSVAEIESSINKSNFERLKKDYRKFKRETHWNKGFRAGVKGGPGKWTEEFTEFQAGLFWDHAGRVADRLGYSRK